MLLYVNNNVYMLINNMYVNWKNKYFLQIHLIQIKTDFCYFANNNKK